MIQKILMCPPDHFTVSYVINPWMENNRGRTDASLARAQWQELHDVIARHAEITLVTPQPGLPDMVFTANAGLVYRDLAVASYFRSKERQGETSFFADWYRAHGFRLADWPQDVSFEGAGDALFDRGQDILWLGFGFRSDRRAGPLLEKLVPVEVVTLALADPRFYHLDTCLCPLPRGYLLYYPPAFSAESQAVIAARVPVEKRIVVSEQDAMMFACNAVTLGDDLVVINAATPELQQKLRAAGFAPQLVNLSEYIKSGGAAKCLTLKLREPAAP